MQALLGVLFHSIGGIAAGSFYMPYNKVKSWAWESFWILGGVFAWLVAPFLMAYFTFNQAFEVIWATERSVFWITFLMGLCWGIGGLTYGLGVRFLGMSLGNSVTLGFCSAFGALVPAIYNDFFPRLGHRSLTDMLASEGGRMVLWGVLVCILGIAICGKAGMMKEAELSEEENKVSIKEFNLVKGLIIATISGILSSFFSYGIQFGTKIAEQSVLAGCPELFKNNTVFVVILWGGFTTNFLWTTFLSIKNQAYRNFFDHNTPIIKNTLFCALAGTTWYLQFFFYGMGESKLPDGGASSWILHMSTIILTANFWGIYQKEWRGVAFKTKATIVAGITVILLSVVIVGIGNTR